MGHVRLGYSTQQNARGPDLGADSVRNMQVQFSETAVSRAGGGDRVTQGGLGNSLETKLGLGGGQAEPGCSTYQYMQRPGLRAHHFKKGHSVH